MVNIGSPASPRKKEVASYLRRFLSDGCVMRMPWLIRKILVNCIIVPSRASHSASLYERIWDGESFPLIRNTEKFERKVRERLRKSGHDTMVRTAMRYGSPSIKDTVKEMAAAGVTELLLIPLYPHFAISTVVSTVNETKRALKRHKRVRLDIYPPFYDLPAYVDVMASRMREADGMTIFSFHGLPLSHMPCDGKCAEECNETKWRGCIDKKRHDDCYRLQCYEGAAAIASKAGIDDYEVAFQSRLGHGMWLKPALDDTMARLRDENVKALSVVAPSFTADCLETLWEIDAQAREIFESSGGELHYIPCLNDDDRWCDALAGEIASWSRKTTTDNTKTI